MRRIKGARLEYFIPTRCILIPSENIFEPGPFNLYFDETEIIGAFKHLYSNNQPLQLEMRIEIVEGKEMFSVALRNDKESVKLKRANLETYGVREK